MISLLARLELPQPSTPDPLPNTRPALSGRVVVALILFRACGPAAPGVRAQPPISTDRKDSCYTRLENNASHNNSMSLLC